MIILLYHKLLNSVIYVWKVGAKASSQILQFTSNKADLVTLVTVVCWSQLMPAHKNPWSNVLELCKLAAQHSHAPTANRPMLVSHSVHKPQERKMCLTAYLRDIISQEQELKGCGERSEGAVWGVMMSFRDFE